MNSYQSPQEFRVGPASNGVNLLSFLAERLGTSRKKAKQLLDNRCVLVNGRRVWMARHVLRTGHTVVVGTCVPSVTTEKPIAVLYQDPDYLIVNKPAGHPSNGEASVELHLRSQLNEPSVLAAHRLDRDTTGCLLIARSRESMEAAVELFRQRAVAKSYHAIVSGRMQTDSKTIARPLEGLSAVSHCKTLDAGPEASHLLVKIDTGRTHQIRKHLAGLGFPIIGDRYYATRRRVGSRAMQVGRQMLHASDLSFRHPVTGQIVRARAPLPRDFRNCLKMFGLT